jgi:hypothetical protein
MTHLVDIVTARALRYGLDAGPRSDSAIRELAELAQGSRRSLELARSRIERGLAQRSSRVGERARDALERALVLVAAGQILVPMLATHGAGSPEARGA